MITCVPEPSACFSPSLAGTPMLWGTSASKACLGVCWRRGPSPAHECASRVLVRDTATTSHVVLLAHAEAYLPGRIDALAADALSEVVSVAMPAATGRQALAFPRCHRGR